jgi:oligoribonuclease (3'-5' exoribonuclease)
MSNNGFAVERDPLFNENNLIWMDLEMTGLEPQINRILEMAAVITDPQLNVIAEGPVVAIHQDAAILSGMDSWNTATHTRSGLVNRCLESKVTEDEVRAGRQEPALRKLHRSGPPFHGPLDTASGAVLPLPQPRRFLLQRMCQTLGAGSNEEISEDFSPRSSVRYL